MKPTAAILEALRTVGPLKRVELCAWLGLAAPLAATLLSGLRQPTTRPAGPRRVRIVRWEFGYRSANWYPRAVYGLGSAPDAPRPAIDPLDKQRRYQARQRA